MANRVNVRDLDQAIADGFVRQLGAGSYGSVWYWRSASDQREMAVKRVNKADARRKQIASGGTLDPIEQARTEALVMRSLNHPNIVSVYDFVETPEALYLMIEYCPGGDLLALLNRVGRLDEPTAAVYFRQLIDAITYIHRSGFVHRDIKCENIFFGVAYNQILLGDFGFSGRWTPGKTLPQSWGSLHYASPEIAQGLPYEGPEVDMWSCGVVLYAMTMAALPFNGPTEADIVDQISMGEYPQLSTDLSSAVRDLIPQLLHVEPSRRPSAASLLSHPFLVHASLPRVHSDPSSHDSPATSLPSSRRASVALSRLPSFYEDSAGPNSARNAALASARTVAQQLLERQLSTVRSRSRRPSVVDMVGARPPAEGGARQSREVSAAALAAALEGSKGSKIISRKSSLGDVASSVQPSPRLTSFPIREPETPRPALSRLSSLRNLTKQKEIAKQAEKKAKEEEERKRSEDEKAQRRKEKQERSEKRRKDKEKNNAAAASPAPTPGVSSAQWSVDLPPSMSEEEKLLWAIQMEDPHRDELANRYLDLIHKLLTDPNLSIHRLPRRRVTVRPSPAGSFLGLPAAHPPTGSQLQVKHTAAPPGPHSPQPVTINLNDYNTSESRVLRRGPWPSMDDENNTLTSMPNPLLASQSNSRKATALLGRLSATLNRHFANRLSTFLASCLSALQPHVHLEGIFKPASTSVNLYELRTQGEVSPALLATLPPQTVTSLILLALSEGKPFLSPQAQTKLLSVATTPNDHQQALEGVRDALRLLPLPNRGVCYVVMTILQTVEKHCERNKMTPSSLAAIFSPVVMRISPIPNASKGTRPPGSPNTHAVELLIRSAIEDLINKKKLLRLSTALTPFLLTQSSSDSSPTGSLIGSAPATGRDDPSPPQSVKGFNAHAGQPGETTSPRRSIRPGSLNIKQSMMLVREGGTIFKVFKPRYVVLTKNGELEVYKDHSDYLASGNRLLMIDASNADLAPMESMLGETHLWLFALSSKSKKAEPLDFACETEADRFSWMVELLKVRPFAALSSYLDMPDGSQAQLQFVCIAIADLVATRDELKSWNGIAKLLQYLENASSSPNESIRDASLLAIVKISSVEELRPLVAPHLPLLVRGVAGGADRIKDLSLQAIVNLSSDATCRGEFRKCSVVPALVTTLASEKMSDYVRENAALSLSIAAADPAIQNLLRSSVLLFSSVFAAALEQENFRLRALIVDLMAHCAKNEELWRLLIQSGVYTALLAAAKHENVELPSANNNTVPSPQQTSRESTASSSSSNASVSAAGNNHTAAPAAAGAQQHPVDGEAATYAAVDRQRAALIVKALQAALRNRISRSPRESDGPATAEIRRASSHQLPVRPDEAARFLFTKLSRVEDREEDIALIAASEFIANYSGTSFGHTQLFRIIALELPPRKSAFSETMVGALRLMRVWVLAHFLRDFWRAKSEGKAPICMFGKLRSLLRATERRLPTLQYECNRVKLAILRKHASGNKAESSPRGSNIPLRRVSSKHKELVSSRLFKDSNAEDNKEDKREKPEKEPVKDAPKGSTVTQTPGRGIKSSGGTTGADKKGESVLSPRKKP